MEIGYVLKWIDRCLTEIRGVKGLQWMMDREVSGDAIDRGHLKLHPCWLQLQTQDRQLIYVHRLLPHHVSTTFVAAPTGTLPSAAA